MKKPPDNQEQKDTICLTAYYKIDSSGYKIYNLNLIIENFIEETQNLLWKNANKKQNNEQFNRKKNSLV